MLLWQLPVLRSDKATWLQAPLAVQQVFAACGAIVSRRCGNFQTIAPGVFVLNLAVLWWLKLLLWSFRKWFIGDLLSMKWERMSTEESSLCGGPAGYGQVKFPCCSIYLKNIRQKKMFSKSGFNHLCHDDSGFIHLWCECEATLTLTWTQQVFDRRIVLRNKTTIDLSSHHQKWFWEKEAVFSV